MSEYGFPNAATPPGSTAYYISRFAKKSHRNNIANLFLLKKQLDDLYTMQDPGVARIKLQWWQQQFSGDKESAHPLVKALKPALSVQGINAINQMALSMDKQLHRQPVNAMQDFLQTGEAIHGSFLVLLDDIEHSQIADHALHQAGQWIHLAENLQLLGIRYRDNIPVLPSSLLLNEDAAQTRTNLQRFSGECTAQLSTPRLSKNSSANRLLQMQLTLLQLLEKEDFSVMQQKISLTPLRKLWIAWRFS